MVEEAYEKDFNQRNLRRNISKPAVKVMAEHTVAADETLSHISLKYYGSAVKDKWMIIGNTFTYVIGDNPDIALLTSVLKIPELPKE